MSRGRIASVGLQNVQRDTSLTRRWFSIGGLNERMQLMIQVARYIADGRKIENNVKMRENSNLLSMRDTLAMNISRDIFFNKKRKLTFF